MTGLLEKSGAQSQKPQSWAPIFIETLWPGLVTNRSVLHPWGSASEMLYTGGRPGTLVSGLNAEVSVRNTMIRRPGTSTFSTATYPTPPDRAFSFQLTDGSIRVLIDTTSTGSLAISSVANSSAGTAVYTGVFPGGVSNAYVGMVFQVTGFSTPSNNGTYTVTASTTTTITLTNPTAVAETISATMVSSGAVYYDQQNGSKTLLFGKAPGAGQASFVAVAGVAYIGDGVDTRKYTPLNTNGQVWNWGIVAPAKQPNVVITPTGSAAIEWVPNTVFSTMGLVFDSTTNTAQQLISVNATGLNTTQLGSTGNGQPAWNQTPGGTTTDNTVTWVNKGPIVLWTADTLYNNFTTGGTLANPCAVYDPATQAVYVNANPSVAQGTSGGSVPSFKPGLGQSTHDPAGQSSPPGVKWFFLGITKVPLPWQAGHVYPAPASNENSLSSVAEPLSLAQGVPTTPPIFLQFTNAGGTSASTATAPKWSTIAGDTTSGDGDMIWLSLGSDQWQANHNYSQWTQSGSVFSAILDTNGNFQVCTTSGQSSNTIPATWGTTYGATTTDGSVVWTCVGVAMTWAASTQWYLPIVGFAPPSPSSPYGGASVIDTNNDVEFVINSGKSQTPGPPSWAAIGQQTTDGAATWFNLETFIAGSQSLVWATGHVYAYSFKARSLSDFYSVNVVGTAQPPIPPGLTNPLPVPTGSETNAISTASPVFTITGANTGAVNTISGVGSTDPQVDTIVIWRDADGGGSDQMFELTEIPAPPPINGIAQPWSFRDFLPDAPTALYPGLNFLIPAPIDDSNDPPPATFLPNSYNFQRIWGPNGQQVNFSGGPDVLTGNPNEAFAPADEFPFLSSVIRTVKSTSGLVVFTSNSIEVIVGGPLTASFYSVTLAPGIGLGNFNSLDVYAGEIFFMDTTGQLRVLSPSLSMTSAGFAITDQLNLFNPATAYVAFNEQPNDTAIYIGTGTATYKSNTGWFRMNPRQSPGSFNGPEPVWSPFAALSNGCQLLQSVQVSAGQNRLLIGSTLTNQVIEERDTSVFTDNGTQYDANFQLGSLFLAHRGELALLKFIEMDFALVTTSPTVSYLLDEIGGNFTPFVLAPIQDPPSLYGATIKALSYNPFRYNFIGNASIARCVHMQVGVDFGTTSNADEVFNLTIYGAVVKNG